VKLLLLNAIKGLWRKKIQIIAIILLLMIATILYVASNNAINRLEDGYYDYLEKQQVEHFSFVPAMENLQLEDLDLLQAIALTEEEEGIVQQAKFCLPDCNPQTMMMLRSIFAKYNLQVELNKDEIDKIAEKHGFDYELTQSKLRTDGTKYYKAILYDETKQINQPYLLEGNLPQADNDVAILYNYAQANNLKIGDQYELNGEQYNIVGTVFLPDYVYPIMTINTPMFDEENNNIFLMNEATYQAFVGSENKVFSARFHEEFDLKHRSYIEGPIFGEDGIIAEDEINMTTNNFLRLLRVDTIQADLEPNRTFTNAFVNVLLGISAVIILIVVKKRIENEKSQVGILKAVGYSASSIASSYLVYPFIGVLFGCTIGYFLGLLLSEPLIEVYVSYYNVPLPGYQVTLEYLSRIFLFPLILLSTVSFIIAFLMVKKPPLYLLKEGSNLKVNFFAKLSNKILKKRAFKTRFKYSLAFRSLGKLMIVTIVSFASGMLITLFMIGSGLFTELLDQTFGNMKFDYIVSYNTFMKEEAEDDLFLNLDNTIVKIAASDGSEIAFEDEITVTLSGLDAPQYLKIEDGEENDLIPAAEENKVLVSYRFAELNKVGVDDFLYFEINDEEYKFIIAGIYQDYFSRMIFIDRAYLSELYGFEEPVYNQKYSIDEKYGDTSKIEDEELAQIEGIFGVRELEKNIEDEIEVFNYVIYVIIAFAALMAFLIMLVIANVIVEENRKNISLMKVLGYKNKEIGDIILNIYTPFIIFAYLISIPAMVYLIRYILDILADDIGFIIPVSISFFQGFVGLIAILIAYYLGIGFSKRVLNKISLSEALKRE